MLVHTVPASGQEVEHTQMSSLLICDSHLTNMLYVHGSEKEITHHGVWSLDREMLSSRLEEYMLEANGRGVQLSLEGKGQFGVCVHVVLIVF